MKTFGEYVTRVPCASSLTARACASRSARGMSRSSWPGISGRRYPPPGNLRRGALPGGGRGGRRQGVVHALRRARVPPASGRTAVVATARWVREGAPRSAPQPVLPAGRRRVPARSAAREAGGANDRAPRGGRRDRRLVRLLRRSRGCRRDRRARGGRGGVAARSRVHLDDWTGVVPAGGRPGRARRRLRGGGDDRPAVAPPALRRAPRGGGARARRRERAPVVAVAGRRRAGGRHGGERR